MVWEIFDLLKPRSALLASVCLLPALLVPSPYDPASAQTAPHHRAAAGNHAVPSGGTIEAINVSGNHRIEADTITSYMVVQPGGPFDPQAINESLKTLYATGLFSSVSIPRDGNDLDVAVVENPTVNQIFFSGNKTLTDKEAQAAISLKSRAVFTPAAAEADRRALLDAYAKKGYYGATVTPNIIRLPDNRVNVVFQCTEGPQSLIGRITFIGNSHFSQSRLREVVSTRQSAWYRFLSTSDQYDPERVEYDEYLLHQFYLHNGYADFNVISANAELSPDRKSFYLTFDISEGPRYRVGSPEDRLGHSRPVGETAQRPGAAGEGRLVRRRRAAGRGDRAEQPGAQSRLQLRAGESDGAHRSGHQEDRHHPERGGWAACLHPAHRHHRQHPHRGQGDPP